MPPLKCPNPTCNFLFDPSRVPAGATLQCPRCLTRFSLGQSAPPPEFARVPAELPQYDSKGRGLASYVLPVLAGMVVVGGIVAAALLLGGKAKPAAAGVIKSDSLNFSFTPPGPPWQPDEETKT